MTATVQVQEWQIRVPSENIDKVTPGWLVIFGKEPDVAVTWRTPGSEKLKRAAARFQATQDTVTKLVRRYPHCIIAPYPPPDPKEPQNR